jgi:hypothetical protein
VHSSNGVPVYPWLLFNDSSLALVALESNETFCETFVMKWIVKSQLVYSLLRIIWDPCHGRHLDILASVDIIPIIIIPNKESFAFV